MDVDMDYASHTSDGSAGYFSSYADLAIHELMLRDAPRTTAYQRYIQQNAVLFKGKTVVDVGAGTGILSLFAAKAGAKKVYAVEASDLATMCRAIVSHNGYSDVITVIHDRVEDANIKEKVDIIVSEWMGFYLLHESMLNSVIIARDKWLSLDGLMVPATANIYVCPVSMKDYVKEKFDFWTDVYGFDFSPVCETIKKSSQPVITTIQPSQCLSKPALLASFDSAFVTIEDIAAIVGKFKFTLTSYGILHGFACWFDVEFDGNVAVELNTGPESDKTHWQQTVMFLPDALMVNKGDDILCEVGLSRNAQKPRRYDITLAIEETVEEETDESESGDCTETLHCDFTDNVIQALERKLRESNQL